MRGKLQSMAIVLFLLVSALSVAFTVPIARSGTSMLANGDFETGNLVGWGVTGVCTTSNAIVHSGSYSGYVSNSGHDNYLIQYPNSSGDLNYYFEGWVYPLRVGSLGLQQYPSSRIRFEFHNKSSLTFAFVVDYNWCWNDYIANVSGYLEFNLPFNAEEWNFLSRNLTNDIQSYFAEVSLPDVVLYSVGAYYHYSNDSPGAFYVDGLWLSTEPPEDSGISYSDTSYSSNVPSTPCNFACKWSSDLGLSGYVFSSNNTGTWVNDTWEPLSGNSAWANVTKVLNSTLGAAIGYRWWCNGTNSLWNSTITQYLQIHSSISYSDVSYSTDTPSASCTFACKWNSYFELSGYIFGSNNTGSWINETWSPLSGYSAWANVTLILNSTSGARIEYRWWCNDTSGEWGHTEVQFFYTGILFNHDQTLEMDLTINEHQRCLIQDCALTFVNSRIFVYGNLTVSNSYLRAFTIRPGAGCTIYVLDNGNFAMIKSALIGNFHIKSYSYGNAVVNISDSTTHDIQISQNSILSLNNSTFGTLQFSGGAGYAKVNNSVGFNVYQSLFSAGNLTIAKSNITLVSIAFGGDNIDLELNPGHIQHSTITCAPLGSNLDIQDSDIGGWEVNFAISNARAHIKNSTLNRVSFRILDSPVSETINLTLEVGFIQNKNLYFEWAGGYPPTNITIEGSTINGWKVSPIQNSKVALTDSTCSIDTTSMDISISNSTIPRIDVGVLAESGDNMTISDSEIGSFYLFYDDAENFNHALVLKSGYQEHLNIHDEGLGTNIEIVRTWVDNWSVSANRGPMNFDIQNSTLLLVEGTYTTTTCISHSDISKAYYDGDSVLILTNSTVGTLYAYGNSNLTIIDSTIGLIFRDPPLIRIENSSVQADLILSTPILHEEIFASIVDTTSISLPENIEPLSKYLDINGAASDWLVQVQVRMYYNESELNRLGISERKIRIYYLNRSLSEWQSCPIQGVNETSNFVWTNVTDLSSYVLGFPHYNHDVGISALTASKNVVGLGYDQQVNITVINYGISAEIFNASIYANTTLVGASTNIALPINDPMIAILEWNTTGLTYGNYTIAAYVQPVPGETDIFDNAYANSTSVHVGVPGDVSSSTSGVYDKKCDMKDIAYLVILFNTKPSSPNWNPNADVDNNGVVNMIDIAIAILNFNKHE